MDVGGFNYGNISEYTSFLCGNYIYSDRNTGASSIHSGNFMHDKIFKKLIFDNAVLGMYHRRGNQRRFLFLLGSAIIGR